LNNWKKAASLVDLSFPDFKATKGFTPIYSLRGNVTYELSLFFERVTISPFVLLIPFASLKPPSTSYLMFSFLSFALINDFLHVDQRDWGWGNNGIAQTLTDQP